MSEADERHAPRQGFGTRAIRAASTPPASSARPPNSVPIYQSVTFAAEDVGGARRHPRPTDARLRLRAHRQPDRRRPGATPSPSWRAREAGFAFASGMAAIHATLVSLLRAGDRIVCTRAVYGSTRALHRPRSSGASASRSSSSTRPTPTRSRRRSRHADAGALPGDHLQPHHRRGRPGASWSSAPTAAGVTVVVDNTFASPYLCRPLELGADLVVESATKWIGGHSDVLAGVVAGPRPSDRRGACGRDRHGRHRCAPFSAFLVLRGMETLHVRMDRHCASALALARLLEARPEVRRVALPGPAQPSPGGRRPAAAARRRRHARRSTWAIARTAAARSSTRLTHPARAPPRWGASRPSPSTRPPARIASSTTSELRGGRDPPGAGARLGRAWRTSTTWSPTSSAGARRRARAVPA